MYIACISIKAIYEGNVSTLHRTVPAQRHRQDSRLLRQKSMGRKIACERKEGRGQSLSFIFLLPDPCIITGH
jgi:hypothetical protein